MTAPRYVEPTGDGRAGWNKPGEGGRSSYTVRLATAWERFLKEEGLPVFRGVGVRDSRDLPRADWPRVGGKGTYIQVTGTNNTTGMFVVEVPPRSALHPQKHMYEERYIVLDGRGSTEVWRNGDTAKTAFEWQQWSVFAIPLNANFQHFNASGDQNARLMSVTTAPTTLRQFHWNEEFIYDCPIAFTDRYGPNSNYYTADGTMWRNNNNHVWESNFVPDAPNMKLFEWKERGGGGRNVMLQMGEGNLIAHISEFQVGTYKKAHRHGPGAYLFILGGEGFSLLWQDGGESERIKADWQTGSLFLAGAGGGEWFHQHFNSGKTPARYLALRGGNASFKYGPKTTGGRGRSADLSIAQGGIQLEYEDENPEVHRIFEEEVRAHGAECRMKALSPYCTGEVGPTIKGEWGDD
ncbi:MAG: hypothetical protein IH797_07115 [Chloroflexi bacterium]|nr:hypothetical protein [Chloroflexota bacterium]